MRAEVDAGEAERIVSVTNRRWLGRRVPVTTRLPGRESSHVKIYKMSANLAYHSSKHIIL